jgi:hypothetical protein
MRKKTFLLFEILVALSLMGMLVSILFSFMVQSMRVEKKMEMARKWILERQNLQIRIQDILTTLAPAETSPSLFTQKFPELEQESIIAIFDNGIDPDPLFSGTVIGRIYLDEHKNLCLAYWPYPITEQNNPWRKEILARDITDFSLSFLKSSNEVQKSHHLWEHSWPKKNTQTPAIVRLILKQNDATLQFAFRLVNAHTIPTWIRST